jgi:hypothetical protein
VGWCACPAFLLSQLTRRRQQGGVCGGQQVATDGRGPVQSSPVAQRARTARGCALARWQQDCCQLPHAKAKKARSEGKATSVAPLFCSGFFFASHNLPFDPFVLLISLPPWIEEGKKPSESVHTPIGRTDRLRCWSARFSVIVARTGGERWTEDGERVRTCTARHGTPGGAEGARAAP